MSNVNTVRKALGKAADRMTAIAVAEATGLTGKEANTALHNMVRSGEVDREDPPGERPTYLIVPGFKPKKRRADAQPDAADSAPATKRAKPTRRQAVAKAKKKAPTRAAKPARDPRPVRAVAPTDKAVHDAFHHRNITLPAATVRRLCAHAMASEHALDALTRQAVIDATKEAA